MAGSPPIRTQEDPQPRFSVARRASAADEQAGRHRPRQDPSSFRRSYDDSPPRRVRLLRGGLDAPGAGGRPLAMQIGEVGEFFVVSFPVSSQPETVRPTGGCGPIPKFLMLDHSPLLTRLGRPFGFEADDLAVNPVVAEPLYGVRFADWSRHPAGFIRQPDRTGQVDANSTGSRTGPDAAAPGLRAPSPARATHFVMRRFDRRRRSSWPGLLRQGSGPGGRDRGSRQAGAPHPPRRTDRQATRRV